MGVHSARFGEPLLRRTVNGLSRLRPLIRSEREIEVRDANAHTPTAVGRHPGDDIVSWPVYGGGTVLGPGNHVGAAHAFHLPSTLLLTICSSLRSCAISNPFRCTPGVLRCSMSGDGSSDMTSMTPQTVGSLRCRPCCWRCCLRVARAAWSARRMRFACHHQSRWPSSPEVNGLLHRRRSVGRRHRHPERSTPGAAQRRFGAGFCADLADSCQTGWLSSSVDTTHQCRAPLQMRRRRPLFLDQMPRLPWPALVFVRQTLQLAQDLTGDRASQSTGRSVGLSVGATRLLLSRSVDLDRCRQPSRQAGRRDDHL